MRTIKFRVWDKNIPKNLTEAEQNAPTGMIVDWDYVSKSDYLQCGINGEYPIMQFTGLLDKNGKEIYEGDIVSIMDCEPSLYKICYWEQCFKWGVENLGKDPSCWVNDNLEEFEDYHLEVVGNIYENHELLESKDE